jgi:lipid-A-disaccharide synthase-like uncharacterized protein
MIEIGLAGAMLLLVAWFFETFESIKMHKALIDLKFAIIYLAGTGLLTLYAYQNDDPIFFWINVCLIALVGFEILYTVRKTRGSHGDSGLRKN